MAVSLGAVRVVSVPAGRVARWVARLEAEHGTLDVEPAAGRLLLHAADGTSCELEPVLAPATLWTPPSDPARAAAELAAALVRPQRQAIVLIRRGGYAIAVMTPDGPTASKVGQRYVQGRTAAGGWSQQRFARRRENQAAELVRAVADVAVRILIGPGTGPKLPCNHLVTGGDRPLLKAVLGDRRLHDIAVLPPGAHLEIGEPRSALLKELPERLYAARITIYPSTTHEVES